MEWIGPDRRNDFKVDQFMNRLEAYGGALQRGLYYSATDLPEDAIVFTESQYQRFGIQVPKGAEGLYKYGIASIIDIVESLDPYLLFWGFSDVRLTDDWSKHKYEITESNGKVSRRCEHDEVETFVYDPDGATNFFNKYIAMPGLMAMPPEIWSSVEEFHNEVINGDRPIFTGFNSPNHEGLDVEVIEILTCLHNFCVDRTTGMVDHEMIKAYFDLSLWAGVLWFLGPLGREFRMNLCDVNATAIEFGECILYSGEVFNPCYYRKLEAIAGGCDKCGIGAWCVENVPNFTSDVFLACEHCVSEGRPPAGFATCGTKICRYSSCPHNPFHSHGEQGINYAHRAHGQLKDRAEERRDLRIASHEERKKLLVGG